MKRRVLLGCLGAFGLGGALSYWWYGRGKPKYEEAPAWQLWADVPIETRDKLFAALERFAAAEGLKIHIGATLPDDSKFQVIMDHADFEIWGVGGQTWSFLFFPARGRALPTGLSERIRQALTRAVGEGGGLRLRSAK